MAPGETWAYVAAELAYWPPKSELARLFRRAGLKICEGRFSIRLEEFDRFSFEALGGDSAPSVDADSRSAAALIAFSQRVSRILAEADLRHRFEIYRGDHKPDLIAYMHHGWPLAGKS